MPILEIEIVGEPDTDRDTALAQELAEVAGEVFDARPGSTWVRLRVLEPSGYAENGGTFPGVRPVFVSVLKRENPTGDELDVEARRLTEEIARVCLRPAENVHVRYEPPGVGRQAFGGRIVR